MDEPPDPSDDYYEAVRLTLLLTLLLLGTHCCSQLYLRWALGPYSDESRDGLPLLLCALSQGIAWAQIALLLLLLSGVFADSAAEVVAHTPE